MYIRAVECTGFGVQWFGHGNTCGHVVAPASQTGRPAAASLCRTCLQCLKTRASSTLMTWQAPAKVGSSISCLHALVEMLPSSGWAATIMCITVFATGTRSTASTCTSTCMQWNSLGKRRQRLDSTAPAAALALGQPLSTSEATVRPLVYTSA
jgi:hypothetical protein